MSVWHATHCRDDNCTAGVCAQLKPVVAHVRVCTARQTCTRCRRWILQYAMVHSRHCRLSCCHVPGCVGLKGRLGAAAQAVPAAAARTDPGAFAATYW
jgi:hypothetical protein